MSGKDGERQEERREGWSQADGMLADWQMHSAGCGSPLCPENIAVDTIADIQRAGGPWEEAVPGLKRMVEIAHINQMSAFLSKFMGGGEGAGTGDGPQLLALPIRVIRPGGDDADVDAESIINAITGGEGGDIKKSPPLFKKLLQLAMNPNCIIVALDDSDDQKRTERFMSWLSIRKENEPVPDWVTDMTQKIPDEFLIHDVGSPIVETDTEDDDSEDE